MEVKSLLGGQNQKPLHYIKHSYRVALSQLKPSQFSFFFLCGHGQRYHLLRLQVDF